MTVAPSALPIPGRGLRTRIGRRLVDLAPYLFLIALELVYLEKQSGAFTRSAIGIMVAGGLCLAFASAGQVVVIMTGGIDLSVGGVISTATCLAATQYHSSVGSMLLWSALILLIGVGAGVVNALCIVWLNLQPFIVTLATWSLWSGIALWILPVEGGYVPERLLNWVNQNPAGLGVPIWILVIGLLIWVLVSRSALMYRIRAVGSGRDAAYLSGVNITRTLVAAYAISGACAAAGGLFLATQISSGSPTIGDSFILLCIASVVIGGASLTGGRGSAAASVAGAYVLTLVTSVVFAYGYSAQLEEVIRGSILIVAIIVVSTGSLNKRRAQGRIA